MQHPSADAARAALASDPGAASAPNALDAAVARVQAAVARGVFAVTGLRAFALATFVLACVALALRAALEWSTARSLVCFAPLVLVPFFAAWDARRKRPSAAGVVAWLDVNGGRDGALVTGHEVGDPAWSARVTAALARVRTTPRARSGRPLALSCAASAFAAAALLVPIPRDVPGPGTRVQTAAIERAQEQLATLEEEVTLAPVVAEELHEALDRLRDEADPATMESTFEALDRASDRVADEARARAESAQSASEALGAAAGTAESDAEAAQKALESALAELNASGLAKGLEGLLPEDLADGKLELQSGTQLDAATLAKLANTLDAKLSEKMARLAARGLLKPGTFGKAGKPGDVAEHVCTAECRKNPGGT